MNSLQRKLKKMTIVLIVASIILVVAYVLTRPPQDPCFDGKRNNHETGVDCGGFCAAVCGYPGKPDFVNDVVVNWVKYLENGTGRYTFVADLSNENVSWGVSTVNYTFTYYDTDGEVIGTRQGVTSVMPKGKTNNGSVKYIIEDGVASNTQIGDIELTLSDFRWEEVTDDEDVDNLNENVIRISETNFGIDSKTKAYTAVGVTKNASKYDFYKVEINVVIYGEGDEVLAAGKTNQLTMAAGDGWGFSVLWPNLKVDGGEIARADYRAETDVFDKNNFMKAYRANQ